MPLRVPVRPAGFAEDVWRAATAMIERDGMDAPVVAELRGSDDFMSADDIAYFDEVRQACEYVIALNQQS